MVKIEIEEPKMEREHIKAWLTKNALTQGIEVVDAVVCSGTNDKMIAYGNHLYAFGNDWHRSLEAALERAETMRVAKIVSLKKNIIKLEKLKINTKDNTNTKR